MPTVRKIDMGGLDKWMASLRLGDGESGGKATSSLVLLGRLFAAAPSMPVSPIESATHRLHVPDSGQLSRSRLQLR